MEYGHLMSEEVHAMWLFEGGGGQKRLWVSGSGGDLAWHESSLEFELLFQSPCRRFLLGCRLCQQLNTQKERAQF